MPTPKMSDVTTLGVRVGATAFYLPDQSKPDEQRYVFGYRIVIQNNNDEAVQLLQRRWLIIDAQGEREEVEGEGVVGQQPTLEPGQAFKYASYCPLATEWGSMEGVYKFKRLSDGEVFDVTIGRFYLHPPIEEAVAVEQ